MSPVTPVVLQFVRTTRSGEIRKLGFTSIGERTDGLTKANVEELSKALASGKLTDREGNPCTDGAWVQGWILVSTVKAKTDTGVDDDFIGTKGVINVAVAPGGSPAPAADESAPFDVN